MTSQTVRHSGQSWTQSYAITPYHGVNRLKYIYEGPGFSRTYSYDQNGNSQDAAELLATLDAEAEEDKEEG